MSMQKNAAVSRFHSTDEKLVRYSKKLIGKALTENIMTPDDTELIREFILEIQSTRQISESPLNSHSSGHVSYLFNFVNVSKCSSNPITSEIGICGDVIFYHYIEHSPIQF